MFNEAEFNAQIARKGKTKRDVAEALHINESTLYRKIKADGDFDRKEINALVKFLDIDDPNVIFFDE